ncbi:hypothetical protein, partial [Escherichia coli]|uniref:hypothetical protein n=1 Tax=Escherichia coli TaxID=562 RepID=UPI0022843127
RPARSARVCSRHQHDDRGWPLSEFAVSRLVIPEVVIPDGVVAARRARGIAQRVAAARRAAERRSAPTWRWVRREPPRSTGR